MPLAARAEIQTLFRGDCYTEAEAAAKLAEFAKQYDTGDEWQARAKKIRAGMLRGMNLERLPTACDLKPIRHSKRQHDGYTVENVAFESLPGFWVTGNLYLPTDAKGPIPGILCPHGHMADNRLIEQTQKRSAALRGWAPPSSPTTWPATANRSPSTITTAKRSACKPTTACGRSTSCCRSAWSTRRASASPANRAAARKPSFSARSTRVAVAVPVVMVSANFYGGCICESGLPIHKGPDHETNNVEIAGCMAPKPLLLVSDGQDWTKQNPQVEFPHLQRIYQLTGARQRRERPLRRRRSRLRPVEAGRDVSLHGEALEARPREDSERQGSDRRIVRRRPSARGTAGFPRRQTAT